MRERREPRSPLLGLGHLLRIRRDQLRFYADMRARHGDAVPLRLGPYRSWLLFHPRDVETVLVDRAAAFIRFPKLTRVLAQWNGDSLIVREGARWRERRRGVLPAFGTRRVKTYAATAAAHAARLCDRFDAGAAAPVTVETDAVMARLSLDIALATLFGAEPPADGDAVERAIQVLSDTAFRETTAPVVLPDWLPLPAKARKRRAVALMDGVVTDLVRRRIAAPDGDRGDLLSMLLEQHGGRLTPARDDAMTLLIAGHETSGALLSWLFLALVEHPPWRARVVAEVSGVLAGRPAGADDVPGLPLLRAAVAEALWLWPPAYSLFLRQAREAVALGDAVLAPGDLVQIVPFAIHRDPRWFAEPDRFDPERFLRPPSWPSHAYLPFGSGPRTCIGQNLALVEACVVAATILGRWEPVAVERVPPPDPKFSLRPRGGLVMTWHPMPLNRA